MSSAESSFPNQSSLLIPYHQQAYLFNSRQEMDLLALSQTELANQLKAYSSMQNPHALLNLAAISQKESPEKLLMSHTARGLSNGQMAGLLGMSLPSANDPYSNRLQASPMTNPLAKKMEDPMTTAAKMNFERGMPYNTTNQLHSIAQLLEANDMNAQVQAQKNMQELLYYQMQQNKMQMQNTGNVGYSVLLNSQNSLNYGGMVPNQSFYNGQIPTKKSPPGYYGQNVEFPEVEILSKKQVESQKALYKQMGGMNGLEAIVSQENETLLRNAKLPAKNIDELKLMSTEQITPYTPKQSVVQPSKQDVHFMNQPKTPQSQLQSASSKGKQVIEEIVIQEDSDLLPQKEIKEIQQQSMVVETPVTTVTEETPVEAQNKDLLKPKIVDNAAAELAKKKLTAPTTATTTRKCFNRLCLTDVNNDSLWSTQKVNNSSVCKTCCDAFNKGQYCHYCQQIYLDDETSASSDDKDWIECESCKIWNHIECETANGLKSLRILLEKNENYKYYCPNCRPNTKSFRAPIKNANKIVSKNLSQSKASSPLNLTETDSQKTPVHHSKPNLEDGLISEEGLKEPTIRKFRIQDGLKGETGVQQQTEVRVENLQEDMARKKLDYVFNKHQNSKKKLQGKIVYTPPENFSFIEKLLIGYGKKIQLNEGEIKSDLDLFRELSLQTAQQISEKRAAARKEEEIVVTTTNIVQTASLMIREPAAMTNFVKSSGGPRNMRLKNKIQQKAAGNATAAKQMVEENDSQDNDDYDQAGGRVLRNRKRLE